MTWHEKYPIIDKIVHTYYGKSNSKEFVHQSNLIGEEIASVIKRNTSKDLSTLRVLDFGCGIGRPMLMLFANYKIPTHACDVNKSAIDFLKTQKEAMPALFHSNFDPPLPYTENSFDAIYSISVWTHLEKADEEAWLKEMRRILKPGGIVMISFIGPSGLEIRQQRYDNWKNVTQTDLENLGRIYIEHEDRSKGTGSDYTPRWGTTMHTPKYISREWSRVLDVVEIAEDALPASRHSYVVLRKAV